MNTKSLRDRVGLIFLMIGAAITKSTKINFRVGDHEYQCIMYVPQHERKAIKTETKEYWADKSKKDNELDEKFIVLDTFESKLP